MNNLSVPKKRRQSKDEFVCLDCTLPICNERSPLCLYRATETKQKRQKLLSNYYQAHKPVKKNKRGFNRQAKEAADRREREQTKRALVEILVKL